MDKTEKIFIADYLNRFTLIMGDINSGKTGLTRQILEVFCKTEGKQITIVDLAPEIAPSDMKAKQWVAFAGLDPRPFESGTSTKKPRSISRAGNRYLRDALYFPALVASQQDEHVSAYYQKLLAAGKKPKQAIVAIMRKMLLALWGMLHTGTSWDGSKFYKMA